MTLDSILYHLVS
ncbi:Protein of unknown function [Pyronema omphalodes CBS 100304]|uniref:Uncharacterized protein n=1 Tax=Pyronema omphalodes (strain CBS 100304) TaxID=1076935 RepID=U4LUI8_PYROM|nr:Protein of unknown function [Pyronema omphalodes CBS 100304]